MPGSTAIYDPPKEGLPYLVVTFTPEGMKIATANSSLAARTIASEGVIRRRSERQSEDRWGHGSGSVEMGRAGLVPSLRGMIRQGNAPQSATIRRLILARCSRSIGPSVAFLNMPLVTCAAIERIQIRQPVKSRCSAE